MDSSVRKDEDGSIPWSMDQVLITLDTGRYQSFNAYMIGTLLFVANLYTLSYTLTTADMNYRCKIPECDDPVSPTFEPAWLSNAVPYVYGEPSRCFRYKVNGSRTYLNNNIVCSSQLFVHTIEEKCTDWIFENDDVTIVKDFHIMCNDSKWKLPLIGTINNLAQFFSIMLFGIISDRFGRKFVVIWLATLASACGTLKAFSTTYFQFAVFEFLDSFFGSAVYGVAYTLAIELTNPKSRNSTAIIISVFYPFGGALMGVIAWYVQDWRKLLVACYSPGLLVIFYCWLVPESIRWLQLNGHSDAAWKIVLNIVKSNGTNLSKETVEKFKEGFKINEIKQKSNDNSFWKTFVTTMSSKRLRCRLITCSFVWFSITFVFYGLMINSVSLVGNKYLNFISTNVVEAPAIVFAGYLSEKFNRRETQCISLILSGLSCIASELIPADFLFLKVVIFLASKCSISVSFFIIYIYTAEIFPTELRSSLSGFVSTVGRFGSMLVPQTILLADVLGKHVPVLTIGLLAAISGGLVLTLPETKDKMLPDTVNEADEIN